MAHRLVSATASTTLFAFADERPRRARVIGRNMQRHRHQEASIRFLNVITEKQVSASCKMIHAIVDNTPPASLLGGDASETFIAPDIRFWLG